MDPLTTLWLSYVRLHLLVRGIRSTKWDAATWPLVKQQLAKAIRMRAAMALAWVVQVTLRL